MLPVRQHVDSAYLCFRIPHRGRCESSRVEDFYLNASRGAASLEPLPHTLWTILPFNETSFYIEVTPSFDAAPLYISMTKAGKIVLTSYATDGTLFCQSEGGTAKVLEMVSSRGSHYFVALGGNTSSDANSPRYTVVPSSDRTVALSFSFVRGSKCPEPVVALDSIPYSQRCEEFFLEKPSDLDDDEWSRLHLQRPALELTDDSTINAEALWSAKANIRAGTVFCTQQQSLFHQLFHYTETLTNFRKSGKVEWEGRRLQDHVNVSISAVFLGHPQRSFPVYLIFALDTIPAGFPIVPQFCFPQKDQCIERLCSPVSGWPKEEPYFHGIGRHTCGPPNVGYPSHMLAIRDCPRLGLGQKELVAQRVISKGTIFPYTGVLSDRSSPYSWYTGAGHNVLGGGIMRYANIYFGFSDAPNASLVELCFAMSDGSKRPILGVALLRDVQKGEPILIHSYGRDADFEVLRRMMCRGNYLELERFPDGMKIQGLDSPAQWYLPGDIVAIKVASSSGSITDIKLYSLRKLTTNFAMGVPLKKRGGSGVEFTLSKGLKAERLKLKKCILLLPDEDYVIVQKVLRDETAPKSRETVESTPLESAQNPYDTAMLQYSWQVGKNRGPVSDSALLEATTATLESGSLQCRRPANKAENRPLLTVRLSQSVFFLLFSCLEEAREARSMDVPNSRSTAVSSPARTCGTQPHKMASVATDRGKTTRHNVPSKTNNRAADTLSRFLEESTSLDLV